MWSPGLVETIILDVLNHSHYAAPQQVGDRAPNANAQTSADRIAVRPEGTSRTFIDHNHQLFAGLIVLREQTSTYQRSLQHLEILRGYTGGFGKQTFARLVRTVLNVDGDAP